MSGWLWFAALASHSLRARHFQGDFTMVAHQAHRFNEQFQHAIERPKELVNEYPISSMLVMFGVGIGVGLIVGQALSGALSELAHEPTMTEKMKHQAYHAYDSLSHMLPESVLKQLKSYTHS
jgi:hypothetical protein